jgi:hypothetical protein
MRKMKNLLAIAGVIALLVPSTAFAQSSLEAYGGSNDVVAALEEGTEPNKPVKQAQAADDGSLPFTGADLGVLGAAGGMLLALGFGLRWLTNRPSQV